MTDTINESAQTDMKSLKRNHNHVFDGPGNSRTIYSWYRQELLITGSFISI